MDYHYKHNFLIGYGEVDEHNKMKISSLLNYLQDIATMHSKTLGYGTTECNELGIGWILLSWHVKMFSYPKGDTNIEIKTWSRGIKGIHAARAFEVTDADGNLVAQADSVWALVDVNLRKPIRPLPGMAEAYSAIERNFFENEKVKIEEPEEFNFSNNFIIQRRDIDTNRHCNNTKYIEYAIELIPQQIYDEKQIEELEVVYKKQTLYGEKINVKCDTISSDEFINVISKESGELSTIIRTKWNKFE